MDVFAMDCKWSCHTHRQLIQVIAQFKDLSHDRSGGKE